MKKEYLLKKCIIIALAGLMTFAACKKDKESQGEALFTATTEHQGGRTSLDPNNGQINWTAGDKIVISNDNDETAIFNLQSGEGTTKGGFSTSGKFNTVSPFIAAYPSDAVIAGDVVTFNLPATQTIGETGTFANGANPMVACSDDKDLYFKNLCGGLGIRLKGTGIHVTAVRIISKNTTEKLWGNYEVSNCAATNPTLIVASNNQGSNVITLNCNVTLTTAAKTFFVMLPPGTLADGFTIEVLDGDKVLATKETTSNIALVERNTVKYFNEILINVEFDGNVEIPAGMSAADIIVTNFSEDAIPDENGDFAIEYSQMLTATNATNNEVVYMSIVSVDYEAARTKSQLQNYELNAKTTALYYALTMIPFGLNQAKDETFNSIKESLYTLSSVKALESAIEQSVNQHGYLMSEDIGDELNALWINLRNELLAPFLDKQSSNSGNHAGNIVLKKDGTARFEQPQIQPNNGRLRGIRLDIESAYFHETSNTWTLNLTGYSDNGVFIGINKGSIVNGLAHSTGGRTHYFIPPMNVGKFMGTFTSLSGLKDYFVDTWRLITEDDFWFDDMTWDMAQLNNITFELNSNEGALIMISPKDDRATAVVNTVYAVMQVVGLALDDILTTKGYSAFFTSLFSDQELCAALAGLVDHPENFKTVSQSLLSWSIDFFSSNLPFINPKYKIDKLLDKLTSSTVRAAIEYVGNGLGTLASWCLFDSFYFTVDAEYNYEPPVLPQLTTNSYEVLSSSKATVTGTLIDAGTYSIVERGICYSTSHNPTTSGQCVPAEGTETGTYTCTLQNLQPGTYYARAYAKNWLEMVGYADNEVSFTIPSSGGGGSGGHDYVDLGLPSGLLWATCNVGADTPEEYGDYFAWGETEPQADNAYSGSSYKYTNGSIFNKLTKYCNNASYGDNGFTDNLTVLLPEDDAATANWGGKWRMPTKEEWQELCNNTTSTWTTQNGVYGRLFTASNGNSVFLPAAGYRSDGSLLSSVGSDGDGDYWSSSLYADRPYRAWKFFFDMDGCYFYNNFRSTGHSVRPVRSSQN